MNKESEEATKGDDEGDELNALLKVYIIHVHVVYMYQVLVSKVMRSGYLQQCYRRNQKSNE